MIVRRTAGRPVNDPGPDGWHGPALALILRDYGWTQADLAAEVHVSTSVVGTWIGWPGGHPNSRPPSRYQVRLICETLEAPRSAFGTMDGALHFIDSLASIDGEVPE